MLAAVHYEEHTNSRVTPEDNSDTETNETGDGVYQIVGAGYPYPALHILTDAEFLEQSIDAANFIQRKASTSTTPGLAEPLRQNMDPADAQDQANIKDAFWGYNGRAPYMMDIADELGFNPATEGYEGSYYVMNNWDEARVGMERRWIDKNGDLQIRRMTRDGAWKIFILLRNASYGEDGKLVRINEGCGDLPGSGGGDGSAPTGCPVIGRISTPMGINIPGYDGPHRGVDIAVGNDTPVQSTISGTAEIFPADGTMDPNGGGYMVNVKNANYTVKFAHLMPTGRVSGDVKIGDVMGQSDDSGASTGPHLHYGIYNNNDINTPLNPMDYMPVTLNYTQPANNDFSTYTGPNVAGGNWGSCNALP